MMRTLSHSIRFAAIGAGMIAAATAVGTAAIAQSPARPVVVVLPFDNNSIGAGAHDFDGLGKGVQDFLITDLASNAAVRLVDRARIEAVLQEQNLAAAGKVDPETAVRIGKMLGAQYAVVGGFLADGRGNAVLTGRTIDIETTQIANPQKITGKSDDVLGLIGQLSTRLAGGMVLAPKPGARGGNGSNEDGDKGAAGSTSTGTRTPPQSGETQTRASGLGAVETFAKPVSAKAMGTRLDVASMKLYSNALDEADKRHAARATELFKQVLAKYPAFEPAQHALDKLANSGN
ncbi:MAG: CsgG/HfaB family protein [Gemmatimonadales bacterium]